MTSKRVFLPWSQGTKGSILIEVSVVFRAREEPRLPFLSDGNSSGGSMWHLTMLPTRYQRILSASNLLNNSSAFLGIVEDTVTVHKIEDIAHVLVIVITDSEVVVVAAVVVVEEEEAATEVTEEMIVVGPEKDSSTPDRRMMTDENVGVIVPVLEIEIDEVQTKIADHQRRE